MAACGVYAWYTEEYELSLLIYIGNVVGKDVGDADEEVNRM